VEGRIDTLFALVRRESLPKEALQSLLQERWNQERFEPMLLRLKAHKLFAHEGDCLGSDRIFYE